MFGEHKQSSRKSVYSQDYNFEFNWLARKEGPKVFLMMRKVNPSRPLGKWGLHPLIHTPLEFTLAQDVGVSQRFSGLGNEPPQTGHTFSVGLTNGVSLHLGHLTAWSFTRLISSGFIGQCGYQVCLAMINAINANSKTIEITRPVISIRIGGLYSFVRILK